tara:strand:+ start:266 stop:1426 length:1161 start_codon:yes stop_codon:yes gene_type:complete
MKVYYWSPFINEVATIKAVTDSINSIKKYSKNKIEPLIIDSVGEWSNKKQYLDSKNINLIKFFDYKIINYLPKFGFFKSRFTYFVIFFLTVCKLHKIISKNKPDYIIVHLLTFIPLILLSVFNYKTKFILRISGYPKLTIFRTLLWKLVKNKIFCVTTPTFATADMLKKKNIFDTKKIRFLPDPVLNIEEIQKKRNIKNIVEQELSSKNSLISIGRLTPQKNFSFLINAFFKISKEYKDLNLFILGDGEEMYKLKKMVNRLGLSKKVFLVGYKHNIYDYLEKSKIFILPSLWEDPGFVLLEAAYLNKTILSSNCPNGPVEILDNGNNGFLFENNSFKSFKENFDNLLKENKNEIYIKKIKLKKKCKEFTLFNHYKILTSIIKNRED